MTSLCQSDATTDQNQGSSRMGLLFFVSCRVIDCFCWQTVRGDHHTAEALRRCRFLKEQRERSTKEGGAEKGAESLSTLIHFQSLTNLVGPFVFPQPT